MSWRNMHHPWPVHPWPVHFHVDAIMYIRRNALFVFCFLFFRILMYSGVRLNLVSADELDIFCKLIKV